MEAAIDYQAQRFEEVARDLDMVLDTIGGDTQERSWQTLRPGGTLVATNAPPPQDRAERHGVKGLFVESHSDPSALAEIGRLLDAGKVHTRVGRVLPLRDARLAHELVEKRQVQGKVVLEVS